ncbi:hypothetical protein BH09MYX1_BH09MYX1_33790 [soil metagenome]
MSKAFVNDDADVPDEEAPLPPRSRERMPITPSGLAAFRAELEALSARGEGRSRRARLIEQILGGVYPQEPMLLDGAAAFGAIVTFEDESGARRTYEIVGPDEADVAKGRIGSTSPIARALLGRRAGDVVILRRPKGDEEVTIVEVRTDLASGARST